MLLSMLGWAVIRCYFLHQTRSRSREDAEPTQSQESMHGKEETALLWSMRKLSTGRVLRRTWTAGRLSGSLRFPVMKT